MEQEQNEAVQFPEPTVVEVAQEGETVEEVDAAVLFGQLSELQEVVDEAERQVEAQLLSMAEELGRTFEEDGQWYQIRCRFNKVKDREVPFLVKLKDNPKTWLVGRKKAVVEEVAEDGLEAVTADMPETQPLVTPAPVVDVSDDIVFD